ncbi:MAG: O-antigen ligase family protein [Patescibacteria group bacterium]
MIDELALKIRGLPRLKALILAFTVWQYVCVLGMAMLGWQEYLIWINLGLLASFIILAPSYESLLLIILSIPFFVALPNPKFDSLSMWRPLFAILFFVWLIREKKFKYAEIKFLPWDKFLGVFLMVGILVTLVFGKFIGQGFKQVLYWVNIYIFYLVMINVLKSKQQIFEIIRYILWSLAIIVTLGFTQLIGTFLTDFDTFWVYWASNITKLYYGQDFASVALYSNSWFSYLGGRSLRVFSIMPDSQSFAYICIFGMCIGTALTHNVFKYVKKWLWSGIRFAGLGLILSGTRAVWVGMLVPFAAVSWAYFRNFQKHLAKKFILPFLIIFILFAISSLINKGLALMRVSVFKEDFLLRAKSIYDLNDASNVGRIKIWKESLVFGINHPLGLGFGNFIVSLDPESAADYKQTAGEINIRYNLPQRYVSAHSLYLQILVETGFVGFVVFCGFWYAVIKYFWHFLRHYKNKEDFLVYFVAQGLIMVFWVLGAAFFDITLLNDKVLMFFLINLGIAGLIVKKYNEIEEIV